MKRILVLGSSGAGKSTFARQLGESLGIETIHLDSYYWQPNWISTPPDEWDQKLRTLLEKESWVMDGNYPDSLALRLSYADTVVFLDRDRVTSLLRHRVSPAALRWVNRLSGVVVFGFGLVALVGGISSLL